MQSLWRFAAPELLADIIFVCGSARPVLLAQHYLHSWRKQALAQLCAVSSPQSGIFSATEMLRHNVARAYPPAHRAHL